MKFKETYQSKKVLLTGHTGFKGSWLLAWLHLLEANVKGYALPPLPEHQLYDQIDGDKLCDSVFNNILAYDELEKNILAFNPDFIFHLAAQPIVRASYEVPLDTFAVNAVGTANVLNAVRGLQKPCIVIVITTDKVYHNLEITHAYSETDKLGGYDPYSASKACAELIVESYRNSFFNVHEYANHKKSIAVARAGNVIGGGDYARDRIIPDVVRAFQKDKPVLIRNPNAIRPWQHVLESLHGYLTLGKKLTEDPVKYATAYNFGPHPIDCWTVEKMVSCAIESWGSGAYEIENDIKHPHESGLLMLNIEKARKELNWYPKYNATEAIQKTINWYKHFNQHNAAELIREQIISFDGHMINASV